MLSGRKVDSFSIIMLYRCVRRLCPALQSVPSEYYLVIGKIVVHNDCPGNTSYTMEIRSK